MIFGGNTRGVPRGAFTSTYTSLRTSVSFFDPTACQSGKPPTSGSPCQKPGPVIQCPEMSVGCPCYVHTVIIHLKCDRTATSLILLRHNEEVNNEDAEVEEWEKDRPLK
jgi:hypothetical protein